MILRYKVESDQITIKDYLSKVGLPNSLIARIRSQNGKLIVNDQQVLNYYVLSKGDLLEVILPDEDKSINVIPVKSHFEIVYEDSYFLIINKEPGLPSIPAYHHENQSLANYVMEYYYEKGIVANIHFVSRLDAPTSGLVLIAKNGYIHYLMQEIPIIKKYLLKVRGRISNREGVIEGGIFKSPWSMIKRAFTDDFINSRTSYKVLSETDDESIVEATLHTGKTHQLRVHFSHIGHPIIGDKLYGNEEGRLYLHSYYLEFVHPVTKEKMEFIAKPDDF